MEGGRAELPQFYNSPILSDITVCFDTHKIEAHRMVLAMSSSFFKAAFTGQFQSTSKEIWLHEDDPEAVLAMIKYIYDVSTGLGDVGRTDPEALVFEDYKKNLYERERAEDNIITRDEQYDFCIRSEIEDSRINNKKAVYLMKLHTVAGKYGVHKLQPQVAKHMKKILKEEMHTDGFSDLVFAIYEETPTHDGLLREVARTICKTYIEDLMEYAEFKDVVRKSNDLAIDLLTVMVEDGNTPKMGKKGKRDYNSEDLFGAFD